MRCRECGLQFDEMNESQPVCPGCGTVPRYAADDLETALLGDAAGLDVAPPDSEALEDGCPNFDQVFDPTRLPIDLLEACGDAEAILQAIGDATFELAEGFRFFRLPTERVM